MRAAARILLLSLSLLSAVSVRAQDEQLESAANRSEAAAATKVDVVTGANEAASSSSELAMDGPEYRLSLDNREKRMTIGFYGQISQFEREGESLMGYAFEAMVTYAMIRTMAIQISLNQALGADGGVSILYTGIRTSVAYALFGDFLKTRSILHVNERPTINFRSPDRPLLSVDGGVDQYFFNGVSRIVPATGVSLGGRYDRTVFGLNLSGIARYGMLVLADQQVPLISLGVGLSFAF